MRPLLSHGVRAPAVVQAPPQVGAHTGVSHSPHRPGDQVAHYRGSTLRTVFASAKPGGMAKGLLTRLKPRSRHKSADAEGAGAIGDEDWCGTGEHARQGGRGGSKDSEGDTPSDEHEGTPAAVLRAQQSARAQSMGPAARCSGADILRADWAVTAFAHGGTTAVRRALASQLLQAARAPGPADWRRSWLAPIGAAHIVAAGTDVVGEASGLGGVRDLLIALTPSASGQLLPNPIRSTFFCMLPLVLLDLQRPRTATQQRDLLVRLAVLARLPVASRPF